MAAVQSITNHIATASSIEARGPSSTFFPRLAPTLTAKPLTPVRLHKGVEAALRIDQIEWIEIADAAKAADGKIVCTISMFMKRDQCRLPTTRLHHKTTTKPQPNVLQKPSRAEPDLAVRRSLDECQDLRNAIMEASIEQSHVQYCHHCNDYQSLLLFSTTRLAMSAKGLLSKEKRVRAAEKLIQDVVEHFQNRQPGNGRREGCQAIQEVALMLHRFLFDCESM